MVLTQELVVRSEHPRPEVFLLRSRPSLPEDRFVPADASLDAYLAELSWQRRERSQAFALGRTQAFASASERPALERMLRRLEVTAGEQNERTLALLEGALRRAPQDAARAPDLLLQLADAHTVRAQRAALDATERVDQERAARELRGQDASDLDTPRAEHRCALRALRSLLARFPAYPARDAALAQLAWLSREAEDVPTAVAAASAVACASRYPWSDAEGEPRGGPAPASCGALEELAPLPPAPRRGAGTPAEFRECSALRGPAGAPSAYASGAWADLCELLADEAVEEQDLSAARSACRAGVEALEGRALTRETLPLQADATPRFREGLEREPLYAGLLYRYGWLLSRGEATRLEAAGSFARLLDFLEAHPEASPELRADALLHVATALVPEGRAQRFDATDAATRFPQDRGWSAEAWAALARVLLASRRNEEALGALERVAQRNRQLAEDLRARVRATP